MRYFSNSIFTYLAICFLWINNLIASANDALKDSYPKYQTTNHVDNYNSVKIQDDYHNLEMLNSLETQEWIRAENNLTKAYLEQLPYLVSIKSHLTKLSNYATYGIPQKHNDRYFYLYNPGVNNQFNLVYTTSLDSPATTLINPNLINKDDQEDSASIANWSVSENGHYVAYGISKLGSDWQEWHIKDVDTNLNLPETLSGIRIKFDKVTWTKNNQDFYYSKFNKSCDNKKTNYLHKVYYHKLNTNQEEDKLIYENKTTSFSYQLSEDGHYLILTIGIGHHYCLDLQNEDKGYTKLLDTPNTQYRFIGNLGSKLFFQTYCQHPHGQVVSLDLANPDKLTQVILETNVMITNALLIQNSIIITTLEDVSSKMYVYDLNGQLKHQLKLPLLGTIGGLYGKEHDENIYFYFTSYNYKPTIFQYNPATNSLTTPFVKTESYVSDYTVKQIFYKSKDKTLVPMFICYKEGLNINGNCPTLLYGYGGFGNSIPPSYNTFALTFMDMGGIYAVAHLRGGSEYGQSWHKAGMKNLKQNVFDDFIYAAKWLVDNKYTNSSKLAINGDSNGGLLVGACLAQRPDLYACAIPNAGVMDMLRCKYWTSEYGSAKNENDFSTKIKYSPYYNIKNNICYPATLITTGDHDDRVVPWHSFKFAAKLQQVQNCNKPILIRIDTNTGHVGGKPLAKTINEMGDKLAFIVKNLNMDFHSLE